MPIRNPFKKAPTALDLYMQNSRARVDSTDKGFEDASVKVTQPIETREPVEYKLSEIDNSGAFVPPSPPEKEKTSFFSRTSTSSTQISQRRSHLSDNEPFTISRESFDSYRRSFVISLCVSHANVTSNNKRQDISARSQISISDAPDIGSLDSRRHLNAYSPRHSFQECERPSFQRFQPEDEPEFEDVRLHDDKPPLKKRGFLSRLGDITNDSKPEVRQQNSPKFLPGRTGARKRGQSGGNEMVGIVSSSTGKVPVIVTEAMY